MASSTFDDPSAQLEGLGDVLKELNTQFLQMVPVRKMKWRVIADEQLATLLADPDLQKRVLEATVLHPLCQSYPPSLSYRRYFMKQLIHKLDELGVEEGDEVYETYMDLLREKEEEDDTLCYKTYILPGGQQITLQESVHLVSQGTTGLSTWQAAQHLVEWILDNPGVIQDKSVLELGSGLGLTGVVLCQLCQPASFTFSDCHPQVLYLLARNIELNLACHNASCTESTTAARDKKILRKIRRQLSLTTESISISEHVEAEGPMSLSLSPSTTQECLNGDEVTSDPQDFDLNPAFWQRKEGGQVGVLRQNKAVQVALLDWENCSTSTLQQLSPEVILAADVVFDTAIIPSLVAVLRNCLTLNLDTGQRPVAYITSTVRNEDTRDNFLIALGAENLSYSILEPPTRSLFHYDRSVPIEILQVFAPEPKFSRAKKTSQ